ncbi:Serine protease inhibitor Kazal-type 4 [Plecturocebus cupreus]
MVPIKAALSNYWARGCGGRREQKCHCQQESSFSRMPICEHMVESPTCSQTSNLVCGTDGVTYINECQLCLARIKTKQDIQITKDGKC